jgi:hypothetical protein
LPPTQIAPHSGSTTVWRFRARREHPRRRSRRRHDVDFWAWQSSRKAGSFVEATSNGADDHPAVDDGGATVTDDNPTTIPAQRPDRPGGRFVDHLSIHLAASLRPDTDALATDRRRIPRQLKTTAARPSPRRRNGTQASTALQLPRLAT